VSTLTRTQFIEDITFMVETGTSLVEAAQRLDSTADAVEIRLRRAGRADLVRALRARDPLPVEPMAAALTRQADAWRRRTSEPEWVTAQRRAVLEGLAS
jgi:hypothetical protein